MELSLKNIGKIGSAAVEINGITVIAGENDTGKSTVGRALFAIFNSLYNIYDQMRVECTYSVERLLIRMYQTALPSPERSMRWVHIDGMDEIAKLIIGNKNPYSCESEHIKHIIINGFQQHGGASTLAKISDDTINDTISHIKDILEISDEKYLETTLNKNLELEFNGQSNNIFSDAPGELQFKFNDQVPSVCARIEKNEVTYVKNPGSISVPTEAIYFDDPFILDDSESFFLKSSSQYVNHQTHLQRKIFSPKKSESIIAEILAKDKLESIYKKISSVCNGDVIRNKSTEIVYKTKSSNKSLNLRNLSTGLKTFVILKTLLTNGAIETNGTIILDEPEIHLHPEWQLLFAELIVLLQKEFKLHILLNTHSPYFLRAVQVYSAKYGIADTCKYYLSEIIDEQVNISDVTDCVDKIYAKLSSPLQRLEDERWQGD